MVYAQERTMSRVSDIITTDIVNKIAMQLIPEVAIAILVVPIVSLTRSTLAITTFPNITSS